MWKTNHDGQPLAVEITVISAQGLKTKDSSLLFPQPRLRPFVTLNTNPPTIPYVPFSGRHVYQTKADTTGGDSPSWGDKFQIPIANTFFSQRHSYIYLHIFTKPLRSWGRKCELGWCGIPATDILEGFQPAGAVRHLSYRVRERDGSRGHGVLNLAVKLVDSGQTLSGFLGLPGPSPAGMWDLTESGSGPGRTVIGIPLDGKWSPTVQCGAETAAGAIYQFRSLHVHEIEEEVIPLLPKSQGFPYVQLNFSYRKSRGQQGCLRPFVDY